MISTRCTLNMLVALTLTLTGSSLMQSQHPVPGVSARTWHMKKGEFRSMVGHHAMPNFGVTEKPIVPVVALTMMYPADWSFQANNGDGKTPHDCNFTFGRIFVASLSPEKTAGLVLIPGRVTLWSENRSLLGSIAAENERSARIYHCETTPPQPLATRIRQLAKAAANKDSVIGGEMQPLPGLSEKLPALVAQANAKLAQEAARSGRPASHFMAEAGRIASTGQEGSTPTEGYFAVLQISRIDPLPGGGNIVTTDIPLQYAVFAPRGELAGKEAMFRAMLDSVYINPAYSQDCAEQAAIALSVTQQTKAKLARIASEMAADNANTARQNALIQQSVTDYSTQVHSQVAANRSAALDHSSQQFALYMGDQAIYKDPGTGDRVQMSSQYSHAWANGASNEYILTDSPSYNPNGHVGSGSWTPMQQEH